MTNTPLLNSALFPTREAARHVRVIRTFALCLCVLPLAPALVSCGARVNEVSTDTGNPPVVDVSLVRVVAADNGVEVTGAPGAVSTPSTPVKVTNVTTGASAKTNSDEDGSFSVTLPGELEDEYSVRVGDETTSLTVNTETTPSATTAPSATSEASTEDAGAVSCLESTGGTPSMGATFGPEICGTYYSEALCEATRELEAADVACNSDSECELINMRPSCNTSCGGDAALNHEGAAAYRDQLDAIHDGICAEFRAEGCDVLEPPCVPFDSVAICLEQKCVVRSNELLENINEQNACVLEHTTDVAGDVAPNIDWRCHNIEAESECQLEQALIALDNSCEEDAECMELPEPPSCGYDNQCKAPLVIAARNEQAATTQLAKVEEELCPLASELGCEYGGTPCSRLPTGAACVDGTCASVTLD